MEQKGQYRMQRERDSDPECGGERTQEVPAMRLLTTREASQECPTE